MSIKDKKPLLPKWRFPEFRNTGEWYEKTLDSLAKRITKKNTKAGLNRVLTNSAVNGVVDQRDYFNKDIANQSNLDNYYIVDVGDYVYNPRVSVTAPVGPISKNKIGKGVMSPLYTVFRFNNHNNNFYEQYFKTTCWHKYLQDISNTGARHDRMSLTNDDFMEMPLPYPSLPEQQKIADCLTSLDELVTAESDRLEAYKAHKKGLMQKLFPAEGKTIPEWRFPEFRESAEWSTPNLEDLIELIEERAGTKKYTLMSVTAGVGLVSQLEKFGKEIAGNSYKNYYVIKKGDFAYNKSATNLFPEGYIARLTDYDMAALPNSIFTCFRIVDENTCPKFVDHLFHANYHGSWLRKFIAVGARTHGSLNVDIKHLLDMPVVLPTLPEQQKISDCLTPLELLVTAQKQKIEILKMHKKGLMQGLFPSTEEDEA